MYREFDRFDKAHPPPVAREPRQRSAFLFLLKQHFVTAYRIGLGFRQIERHDMHTLSLV